MKICTNCEYMGKPQMKGHIMIELVLWLCYIIPGMIYSVWRYTGKKNICPECGEPSMISLKTPKGKRLVEKVKPQEE